MYLYSLQWRALPVSPGKGKGGQVWSAYDKSGSVYLQESQRAVVWPTLLSEISSAESDHAMNDVWMWDTQVGPPRYTLLLLHWVSVLIHIWKGRGIGSDLRQNTSKTANPQNRSFSLHKRKAEGPAVSPLYLIHMFFYIWYDALILCSLFTLINHLVSEDLPLSSLFQPAVSLNFFSKIYNFNNCKELMFVLCVESLDKAACSVLITRSESSGNLNCAAAFSCPSFGQSFVAWLK